MDRAEPARRKLSLKALAALLETSVPFPFRFFLRKGWENRNTQVYAIF
jgi:hypothetical protein